jgi:hypothetical protein
VAAFETGVVEYGAVRLQTKAVHADLNAKAALDASAAHRFESFPRDLCDFSDDTTYIYPV